MTYLLDNNVISYFLNVGKSAELAACAGQVPMMIVDEVRVELEAHRTLGQQVRRWLPTSNIAVKSIIVGSPEDTTNKALNPTAALKDRGEKASIALAVHDQALTFVANDKNGLWLALRELHATGERVLGLAVFLRRLREQCGLDIAVVDDVFRAGAGAVPPTWWADWRASQ